MRFILSRLSRREKYIFYIALAGILVVFFDRIVVQQVINKLNTLNREIRIHEKRLQRSLYILSREDLITLEHRRYTKDLKQIYSDEEEKSKLLSQIEKLARKSAVFLVDIKPGVVERVGPYKRYKVNIEVESEIAFLADFIYQLERSPRLLRVADFRLVPKKKRSPILKARLTITELLISSEETSTKEEL